MLLLVIGLVLIYGFFNGYRDTSSVLAGVVASRAIRPRLALVLVAIADLIAPFLFGAAVSRSIAAGLVNASAISLRTIVVAMIATLGWNVFTWWRGIPSSSTHALIGGLLGAILITAGPHAILFGGLLIVLLPLLVGPLIGLLLGLLLMYLLLSAFSGATPKVNTLFRRLQVFTMLLLAMSNSANDSHKSMGIIALGLVLAGRLSSFEIPTWVLVLCAAALALGSSFGDWRQIRNLGGRIYRIRPLNALASQAAASILIVTASILGMPVSTPHLISTALMGSGAAERVNKVRWHVASEMAAAWALTIPATMLLSALICMAVLAFYRMGWV